MTVTNESNKVSYTGTGVNTGLAVNFPFIDETDLIVTRRVTATGVETTMALATDYTVTGGNYAGGSVTPVDGATDFPATVMWIIRRLTPRTQATDYVRNDNFSADTHERALDKATYFAIDRKEEVNRSLKVPVTDEDPAELPNRIDRANKVLSFDSNGDPIAQDITLLDSGVAVTSFMETVLDDVDAAAARATLGADPIPRTFRTETGNYSAVITDDIILCNDTGGSGFTVTLPARALSTRPLILKKIDANVSTITIATPDAATIDGSATNTISLVAQYNIVTLLCDGADWHIIS